MPNTLHDLAAGMLVGLFSVFLVMYAFQPTRPYPSWILQFAEQPWIFFLLLAVFVYLLRWDYIVGVLGVICMLAVLLDLMVFTSAKTTKERMFVPSISLIPEKEGFGSEVLPDEEQVSKRWTVNDTPAPRDLMRNNAVDPHDTSLLGARAGVPLASLPEPRVQEGPHYPLT